MLTISRTDPHPIATRAMGFEPQGKWSPFRIQLVGEENIQRGVLEDASKGEGEGRAESFFLPFPIPASFPL